MPRTSAYCMTSAYLLLAVASDSGLFIEPPRKPQVTPPELTGLSADLLNHTTSAAARRQPTVYTQTPNNLSRKLGAVQLDGTTCGGAVVERRGAQPPQQHENFTKTLCPHPHLGGLREFHAP